MREERLDQMAQYVLENKSVSLDTLCEYFQISKNTVRRDIDILVVRGYVKKIYGGVTAEPRRGLDSYADRNERNTNIKQRVAAKAAELVMDGDVIFIDSGTTTKHMVEGIRERRNITILTNNLDVILQAVQYPNLEILSLAGILNRRTFSFSGQMAADNLGQFNIAKAFMASTGISIKNGATNASPEECAIKRTAIKHCNESILLIDQSKYDITALMSYCSLDQIDTLITDVSPPQEYAEFFALHQHRIIVA